MLGVETDVVLTSVAERLKAGDWSGFGAELAALVQEHCFYHLEAPIARVAGWDTPYPHAHEWHLKDELIPLELVQELGDLGVFGLTIPEEYGGGGRGITEAAAILRVVAASGAASV